MPFTCRCDEGTNPVREQGVSDADSSSRRLCDAVPAIRFLGERSSLVVIPIERHERRELHPTIAEFFVCVTLETTGVCADEGDLEDLEL